MRDKLLIVYASKYGSTKEIAEYIEDAIREWANGLIPLFSSLHDLQKIFGFTLFFQYPRHHISGGFTERL